MINLNVCDKKILFFAEKKEIGKAQETIICLQKEGLDINLTINAKYLIDAVKNIKSNTIIINLVDNIKPFVVQGQNETNLIHLILPVSPAY